MTEHQTASDLLNALAHDCEKAMSLVDVLLEEQASLVKMETQQLEALALKKEAMMLDLEKRYQTHIRAAQRQGFEPSFDGLTLWADRLAKHDSRLTGTLSTLKTTLAQARRLNDTNGEIVAEQLAGIQQRINILTAAAVAPQQTTAADTYGPKGAINSASQSVGATPRAVIR